MNTTKRIVTAALLAAFTCIATMIIKIPTPTFGYIHLGDGLVLLCGFIMGPVQGALAAGIGSMFADIFSGYASWAPATLIIKAVTALISGLLFRKLKTPRQASVVIGGLVGEAFMVFGYFAYEVFLAVASAGEFTSSTFAAGIAASATGVPFNIVQGLTGIVISVILLPILSKISDIKELIQA